MRQGQSPYKKLFSHTYCLTFSTLLTLGLSGPGCRVQEKKFDSWDKLRHVLSLEQRIQYSVQGTLEYCTQPCDNKEHNTCIPYDKSMERLRAQGFDRHLYAHEAFNLFFSDLEHVLTGTSYDSCKKINDYAAGWLSLAFERQKSTLVAYVNPEGLVWNGKQYEKTREFRCSERKEFSVLWNISSKPTRFEWLDPEFIRFLCGRSLEQIPLWLERNNCSIYVWLPEDGEIWPISLSLGKDVCVKGVDVALSRGVSSHITSHHRDCFHEHLSQQNR